MKVNIKPQKISTQFKTERIYPGLESLEVIPTTEEQNFKSSKYGFDNVTVKKVTSDIDSNIKPEHIKEGINILGVDGGYSGIDTSDATATAGDLLKDKTAYANGQQITGTIEEYDGSFSGKANIGDADLIPENIKAGVEILGVVGTMEGAWDTTQMRSCYEMFYKNTDMVEAPYFNTENVNNMYYMFYGCTNLTTIPLYNTSNVTNMRYMFSSCKNLKTVPCLDTGKVTNISNMFNGCSNLETLPLFDTKNVTNMYSLCTSCNNLTTIPLLNAEKVTDISNAFSSCDKLTNLGGFLNLGKAYTAKKENNYSLVFIFSKNLTHESLMNVINNLYDLNLSYDVANGGTLYTQRLELGSTNLAKLTAEEIAIATAKGWTVS